MENPHVLVMTDDIYEHIHFDGDRTPHLLEAAPALRGRVLLINGVSKTYAMTGCRSRRRGRYSMTDVIESRGRSVLFRKH